MRTITLPRSAWSMACIMTLTGATMSADDQMLVHLNNASSPHKIEVSGKTKKKKKKNIMNVSQSSGTMSINIADIDRMVFDLQTSSADEIDTPLDGEISFAVTGRRVTATSTSGGEVTLRIYDTAGHTTASLSSPGTVEFDFSGMQPGVYIILCNGKTIKYLNK